ncbi:hypothetical protein [Roseomonas sp. CECT 9278]|uniref:hypothetical protein n=1 Tax=Roseomonas sp. CECT 9278 TaxID=2845823 RepID=UPI001E478508|nr:hypothetical protein [Roseomonas sp. CECT 9278]CAH0256479.1 hypothetical protein ROS9278_03282 [Roseomonas sp. CECT 9278]
MTRISLAERGDQIMRKRDAGFVMPAADALRNTGLRRTADKHRLLETLRQEAETQRRALPFTTRIGV